MTTFERDEVQRAKLLTIGRRCSLVAMACWALTLGIYVERSWELRGDTRQVATSDETTKVSVHAYSNGSLDQFTGVPFLCCVRFGRIPRDVSIALTLSENTEKFEVYIDEVTIDDQQCEISKIAQHTAQTSFTAESDTLVSGCRAFTTASESPTGNSILSVSGHAVSRERDGKRIDFKTDIALKQFCESHVYTGWFLLFARQFLIDG